MYELRAVFAVADTPKETSAEAVRSRIKEMIDLVPRQSPAKIGIISA